MKKYSHTMSMLLAASLLSGCEIWPDHGVGGVSEVRSSQNYYTSEIGFSKERTTLQRQLSNARLQLDMAVLQGALTCLPASVKTNAMRINRIQRELDGLLIEDAYSDLVILSQSLQQLQSQLAYVSHHTHCASAESAKDSELLTAIMLSGLTLTVQFDHDDSNLSAAYRTKLDEFSRQYQQLLTLTPQKLRIRIRAHTDKNGSTAGNDKLAQKRAHSVKALLLSTGIQQTALSIDNHSEQSPLLEASAPFSHGMNRRVELSIYPEQPSVPNQSPYEPTALKDWNKQVPRLFLAY